MPDPSRKLRSRLQSVDVRASILKLARVMTASEIGERLGVSADAVERILAEELEKKLEAVEIQGRAYAMKHIIALEECERKLFKVIESRQEAAIEGDSKAAKTMMEAIDRVEKIAKRSARILGLDAPIKVSSTSVESAPPARILEQAARAFGDEDDDGSDDVKALMGEVNVSSPENSSILRGVIDDE